MFPCMFFPRFIRSFHVHLDKPKDERIFNFIHLVDRDTLFTFFHLFHVFSEYSLLYSVTAYIKLIKVTSYYNIIQILSIPFFKSFLPACRLSIIFRLPTIKALRLYFLISGEVMLCFCYGVASADTARKNEIPPHTKTRKSPPTSMSP